MTEWSYFVGSGIFCFKACQPGSCFANFAFSPPGAALNCLRGFLPAQVLTLPPYASMSMTGE